MTDKMNTLAPTDDRFNELKRAYEQNLLVELQNQLLRRQHQLANRKLLVKIRKEFEKLVEEGGAGAPEADRMIRVIRNLDDMIVTADKGIVDIDKQFKEMMDLVKVRYPDSIEAERKDLERELVRYGLIKTDEEVEKADLFRDEFFKEAMAEEPVTIDVGEGGDSDYEIGS